MRPYPILRPLVDPVTYLRAVYLLLAGIVLMPYLVLTATFAVVFRTSSGGETVLFAVLAAAALTIGLGVSVLPAARTLAIVATRTLLGVALPEPDADSTFRWSARWRTATWYFVSVITGGATLATVLYALPIGTGLIILPLSGSETSRAELTELAALQEWAWPTETLGAVVASVGAGLTALILAFYIVAGAGNLLTRLAPVLLGPTETDEIAALQRRERISAVQNEIARELHDSIGHALTAITVQASAAGRVIDRDPAFACQAITNIENIGRAALDDLDHVLGILRSNRAGNSLPHRSLADSDSLFSAYPPGRIAATVHGDFMRVPSTVSREAYRVLQESLTNAIRHGPPDGIVDVTCTVADSAVTIEVSNFINAAASARVGHGLRGLRERIAVLGGHLSAQPDGDRWTFRASVPWESR